MSTFWGRLRKILADFREKNRDKSPAPMLWDIAHCGKFRCSRRKPPFLLTGRKKYYIIVSIIRKGLVE